MGVRNAPHDEPIAFGVVGAGVMGERVADVGGSVGLRLVALAEANRARHQALQVKYSTPVVDSWRALLDTPGLEAIYIGLPHHLHAEVTFAALERGIHVLLDKPMCTTLAEGDRILAAAGRSSANLMIGFSHRFVDQLQAAKRLIDAGELGSPLLATDVIVEAATHTPDWYWNPKVGGGVLHLEMHHSFDRMCWLMNTEVSTVSAARVKRPVNGFDPIDSSVAVSLTFANGAIGTAASSFALDYVSSRTIVELVIQGSHGHVRVDTWKSLDIQSATIDRVDFADDDGWLARELDEFAGSIREGRRPVVGETDGYRTLLISLAVNQSIETGRTVTVRSPFG